MAFYLMSEGLACASALSGAYTSLKALSVGGARVDKARLASILELWIVLAAMAVLEEYVEFLVAWLPFYYLSKCLLLVLLLMPHSKLPHVLFESFVQPAVAVIKLEVNTRVVPLVEAFVLAHGHWFNRKLLTRSLELFDDDELATLQRDLEAKLADVRDEICARQRGADKLESDEQEQEQEQEQ